MIDEEYITVREAAKLAGLHRMTIMRLLDEGQIRHSAFKCGKKERRVIRIHREAFLHFIRQHEHIPHGSRRAQNVISRVEKVIDRK